MRVLHLQPSSNRSDAIYCSFTIHKVKACNSSYKAVSHVWYPKGISQERVTIQIADGDHIYPLEIRPNQERALRQIRHPSHKVCLWIDALCINQKDMEEKAHQNKMMPFIFQSASEVIVWLGDGDDDTEKAMKFIPQLIDLTDFDRLLKSEETPAQWQALVKLLENPYFSRRWVFLEVILARRAVVHCGAHSVLWDEFCDAVLLLGSRFEDIQFLCKRFALTQDTGNRLEELADLRALSAYSVAEASRDLFRPLSAGLTSSLCTLGTLVSFLPGLQTRDPRDVIWALLPVASDAVVTGIHMDFDMHASTLYQQFARYCADTTNTIDIICTPWAAKLKDSISFLQPYPPLPSWICSVDKLPFGRRKKDLYGRKNGDVLVGRPNRTFYNAAQNSIAVPVFGTTSELGHTILDGTMIVSGFQLGTISELGNRAAAGTLHSEWVDMSGWQPGDKVVPDMLWRTLVADRGPDGTRTPPWYHRACLYWLDAFEGEDVTYDVLQHKRHPSSAVQYMQRVQTVIWNRKLFVFANRSGVRVFGLAPQEAKLHDSIAILHGCSVPVILRQDEKGWRLIGECFVYGNMDGEAMKDEENKKHTQEFLLY
ncbi:heterokaryon incompatibility protein-domain-containing protein [Paraphoma chrysanthemicola]|nr:heterokaryon incompatibility protein-domain-containing protein [Paraphoma chrysanthemicola]